MDSTQVLGSVEVEVKANLDKLKADFARGKQQARAFQNDMVTVNRYARQMENAQDAAVVASKRLAAQQIATARAINAVTRATNPAIASTRLVSSAVRDAEKAYMAGSISAGALARAQQIGAPWLQKTDAAASHMGRSFLQTARSTRFLISALGFSAIGAGAGFLVKTLQATAALGDQAKQLGLTTAQLQEYHGIAAQVGMSAEDMDSAFSTLGKNIEDLSLGKVSPFSKMLKKMGIDIRDAAGNIKPTDTLFKELIDRLGQVGNEAQRRGGQMIAFGEAGAKMGQLTDQGSAGIDRLRKAVADTGGVLSEKEIQDADQAAKKLDEVKTVLSADFSGVVANNAAAIVSLAHALSTLASSVLGFLNSDPQSALAIMGALGGAVFGPEGAAVGALGGLAVGTQMKQSQRQALADSNMDLTFRMQQVRDAKAALASARSAPDMGGRVMPGVGTSASAGGGANIAAATNELVRQTALLTQATSAVSGGKAGGKKGPNIDLSGLLSPKVPKGPRAKFDQFDADMAREKQQQLQLERDATGSLVRQNEIDHEIVDMKLAQQIESIKRQQHGGQLTAAEAKQLIAEAKTTAAMEKEAADRKMRIASIERANQYSDELAQLEQEGLEVARSLARTDEDRKKIDLAILDSKQQQAVSEIDKQIALATEVEDETRIAELTAERRKLLANQMAEIKQFDVEHLTGFDKFKNDLPRTDKEIKEAVEKLRFDLFNQKLQQAAEFAGEIGDAFGHAAGALARFESPLSVLQGLISDLAQTFTKNFIEKPIADWATTHLGLPMAKQGFGKDIAGMGGLDTQQLNIALAQASGNVAALAGAAAPAGPAVTGLTAAATPASVAINSLAAAATAASAALAAVGASGAASGGADILGSILSIAGSAAGGGIGAPTGFEGLGLAPPGLEGIYPGFGDGGFTGPGNDNEVAGLVHRNEWVLDAAATRRLRPLLPMLDAGRLPNFGSGLGAGPLRGSTPLHVQFGDMIFPGVTDARTARASATQVTSRIHRGIARVVRRGMGNSA